MYRAGLRTTIWKDGCKLPFWLKVFVLLCVCLSLSLTAVEVSGVGRVYRGLVS